MPGKKRLWCVLLVSAGLMASVVHAADLPKPIRVLLVLGGCCHDYAHQKDILATGIAARANVAITVAYDPNTGTDHKNPVYDNPDWASNFDVVIHDECSSDVKDAATVETVLKPHKDGLPAVILHCGMHCYRTEGWNQKGITPWFEFTGLPTTGHGAQLPIAITFLDKDNPITRGMENWSTIQEELYNNRDGKVLETARPLARGRQGNNETVVVWTNLYKGKTRVFGTTLGHNTQTVADPRYLDLVTRGLLWATDKLDESGQARAGYGKKPF